MPKKGEGRRRWNANLSTSSSTPEPAIVITRILAARRQPQSQKITTVATNRDASTFTDPRSVKNHMIAVSDGDARAGMTALAHASKRDVSPSIPSPDTHPSNTAAPLARASPAAARAVKVRVDGET